MSIITDIKATFLLREDNLSMYDIRRTNLSSMWTIQNGKNTKFGKAAKYTRIVKFNISDIHIKNEHVDRVTKVISTKITSFNTPEQFSEYISKNTNYMCEAYAKLHEDKLSIDAYATDIFIVNKFRAKFGPKYSIGDKVMVISPYSYTWTIVAFRMLYNNSYQYQVMDENHSIITKKVTIGNSKLDIPDWFGEAYFKCTILKSN